MVIGARSVPLRDRRLIVFDRPFFKKAAGCRGGALTRTPQSAELPTLPESSSFGSWVSSMKPAPLIKEKRTRARLHPIGRRVTITDHANGCSSPVLYHPRAQNTRGNG